MFGNKRGNYLNFDRLFIMRRLIWAFILYFNFLHQGNAQQLNSLHSSIVNVKSQLQLIDSHSVKVCIGDSLNFGILIKGLDKSKPSFVKTYVDTLFQNVNWQLEYPLSPNNYSTAFFKLSIPNSFSNKRFNPFFLEFEDSSGHFYFTYNIRLVDSLDPQVFFVEDSISTNFFNASYYWFLNGSLLNGPVTKRIFKPSESGVYTVSISSSCKSSNSNGLYYEITGIEENKIENQSIEIYLFPNPIKSEVYISIDKNQKIKSVEIYDLYGVRKEFISIKANQIVLTNLISGMYFMKVSFEDGQTCTKKFQKI